MACPPYHAAPRPPLLLVLLVLLVLVSSINMAAGRSLPRMDKGAHDDEERRAPTGMEMISHEAKKSKIPKKQNHMNVEENGNDVPGISDIESLSGHIQYDNVDVEVSDNLMAEGYSDKPSTEEYLDDIIKIVASEGQTAEEFSDDERLKWKALDEPEAGEFPAKFEKDGLSEKSYDKNGVKAGVPPTVFEGSSEKVRDENAEEVSNDENIEHNGHVNDDDKRSDKLSTEAKTEIKRNVDDVFEANQESLEDKSDKGITKEVKQKDLKRSNGNNHSSERAKLIQPDEESLERVERKISDETYKEEYEVTIEKLKENNKSDVVIGSIKIRTQKKADNNEVKIETTLYEKTNENDSTQLNSSEEVSDTDIEEETKSDDEVNEETSKAETEEELFSSGDENEMAEVLAATDRKKRDVPLEDIVESKATERDAKDVENNQWNTLPPITMEIIRQKRQQLGVAHLHNPSEKAIHGEKPDMASLFEISGSSPYKNKSRT